MTSGRRSHHALALCLSEQFYGPVSPPKAILLWPDRRGLLPGSAAAMVRRPLPPEGNDVSDIFDEINEDLRAERAHRLMRRYGGLLAGMAVLAILGVGTYQGWKYYQQQHTARQADSFLAAMHIADGPDGTQRQAALPAFTKLGQDGNAGYRTLSRLREAALKAAGGDGAGAAALWNQISADTSAD